MKKQLKKIKLFIQVNIGSEPQKSGVNIENLDEQAKDLPIVREVQKNKELNCVMSNSFGFGGTNATLVFEKV